MWYQRARLIALVAVMSLLVASCAGGDSTEGTEPSTSSTTASVATTTTAAPETTTTAADTTTTVAGHDHAMHGAEADPVDVAAATLATAAFQDVAAAEAAGWGSTIDALGCFQNLDVGGMGVHYLNNDLMDDQVDVTRPEALVYELDADGEIVGLVAHEYIVPVEVWVGEEPPTLFGQDFHQHPVLPLWVLHTWLWKDNPLGTFNDWNPTVRQCPEGVPIFGVDLP